MTAALVAAVGAVLIGLVVFAFGASVVPAVVGGVLVLDSALA